MSLINSLCDKGRIWVISVWDEVYDTSLMFGMYLRPKLILYFQKTNQQKYSSK